MLLTHSSTQFLMAKKHVCRRFFFQLLYEKILFLFYFFGDQDYQLTRNYLVFDFFFVMHSGYISRTIMLFNGRSGVIFFLTLVIVS